MDVVVCNLENAAARNLYQRRWTNPTSAAAPEPRELAVPRLFFQHEAQVFAPWYWRVAQKGACGGAIEG